MATPFLRLAGNAGVPQLADGVGMRVEQAAETFFWWRGVRPDTSGLIDQILGKDQKIMRLRVPQLS